MSLVFAMSRSTPIVEIRGGLTQGSIVSQLLLVKTEERVGNITSRKTLYAIKFIFDQVQNDSRIN